jgi:hypothetical protein
MKKYLILIIVLILIACNQSNISTEEKEVVYDLKGNWCFLNSSGIYTESFFSHDMFRVYNKYLGISPDFKYYIVKDTLVSTFNTGKKVRMQKSLIAWINEDKVVMHTSTGADTMERISRGDYLLGNIDRIKDSANFAMAFAKRNENFLIQKGILTMEEVDAFRKDRVIPEDVKQKRGQ